MALLSNRYLPMKAGETKARRARVGVESC